MLQRNEGIILHTFPYAENGVILKVFTRDNGLLSYIISTGKGKKGKNKALLQPLSLVQLVATSAENGKMGRVTEISSSHPYYELQVQPVKSCIAMFLNEILYRSLKEDQADEALFDFLSRSFRLLDVMNGNLANFHLCFLIHYSRFLGFSPQGSSDNNSSFFDLQEGRFTPFKPVHPHFLSTELAAKLSELLPHSIDTSDRVEMSGMQRKALLTGLCNYFRLHVPGFGELRSQAILEEILA